MIILQIFADNTAGSSPEDVAAVTDPAAKGFEPLEAMLTLEVVGQWGRKCYGRGTATGSLAGRGITANNELIGPMQTEGECIFGFM
jgi:hypothetical protein